MRTDLTGRKNRKGFAATDHLVKVPPELRVSSGSTSLTPPCEEEDKAPENDVKRRILGDIPLLSPAPRKEPAIVTPPAPVEEKREEPRRSKRQLEITAGVEKGEEAKRKAAETVEHEKMVPVVVIPVTYVEEDEDDEPVTDRSRKAKSKPISSSAPRPQLIAPVAVMHSHRNEEVQEESPVRDRRIEGGKQVDYEKRYTSSISRGYDPSGAR
ncbi:hypothetical protein FPQ18DRAFT_35923 [Pyronema domesticum]|nr:hypothetical protein FPQ18DRAFT_35923 [Pyronema domesticum]